MGRNSLASVDCLAPAAFTGSRFSLRLALAFPYVFRVSIRFIAGGMAPPAPYDLIAGDQ